MRSDFIATPAALHNVYSFLSAEDKLPHCAVCKTFQNIIGASDLFIPQRRNTHRFVTSFNEHGASAQFKQLATIGLGGIEGFSPADLKVLSSCIKEGRLPNITRIVVQEMVEAPPGEALAKFSEALMADALPRLELLHLKGCNLGERGVKQVADAIHADKCPRLTSLNLSGNNAGMYSCKDIGKSLRHSPLLTEIDLTGNMGEDVGVKALADSIRFLDGVKILRYGGNKILVGGGEQIAEMVIGEYLTECEIMEVGSSADDPRFAMAMAKGFASGACPVLTRLDMSGCGMFAQGAEEFCSMLCTGQLPSLKELVLHNNAFGERGIMALVSAVTHKNHHAAAEAMAVAAAAEAAANGGGGGTDSGVVVPVPVSRPQPQKPFFTLDHPGRAGMSATEDPFMRYTLCGLTLLDVRANYGGPGASLLLRTLATGPCPSLEYVKLCDLPPPPP